ncbi:MAG: right-handed parallel beta-helix repeat-containing protein [bacterium]
MKFTQRRRRLFWLIVCCLLGVGSLVQAQCDTPSMYDARPIFYINPGPVGSCIDCVQDLDLDLVEYFAIDGFASLPSADCMVYDNFDPAQCGGGTTHGEVVKSYFSLTAAANPDEFQTGTGSMIHEWIADILPYVSAQGAVCNLSLGPLLFRPPDIDAINDAYNSHLLLVGATATFNPASYESRKAIGDKILTINHMLVDGSSTVAISDPPNFARVGMATNWLSGVIASPIGPSYPACQPMFECEVSGKGESGSYSTPLCAGIAAKVAGIVQSRLGYVDIDQTLDYLLSSCYRPRDGSFAIHTGVDLPTSHGPWSDVWAYGILSGWKALVYASGYGTLEAEDFERYFDTYPEVRNPATEFSDDFELRGDLYVPWGQSLVVTDFCSVDVVTTSPEGPDLGNLAALQEIRAGGELTIEGAVNASVTVDNGGDLYLADGGCLTIGPGQVLYVYGGGDMTVEPGGSIIIESGGQIQIEGGALIAGTLQFGGAASVANGGNLMLQDGSQLFLDADLYIDASSQFVAQAGSEIVAADVPTQGGGALDPVPGEVELVCEGFLVLSGVIGNPAVLRSEDPGSADWGGVYLDSGYIYPSIINATEISDALKGLHLLGPQAAYLQDSGFDGNDIGLQIEGRNNDSVLRCTFTSSATGLDLISASPSVTDCTFWTNTNGISCTSGSDPVVRECTIYNNNVGVRTMDSGSVPDLGSYQQSGLNDFAGDGHLNTWHICAFDPDSDILALENWWGTTSDKAIQKKLLVLEGNPPAYGIIFLPKLSGPPAKAKAQAGTPGADPEAPAIMNENEMTLSFLSHRYPAAGDGLQVAFRTIGTGHFSLTLYDIRGRLVKQLVNEQLSAGEHLVVWDGSDTFGQRVASGTYLARLVSQDRAISTKYSFTR